MRYGAVEYINRSNDLYPLCLNRCPRCPWERTRLQEPSKHCLARCLQLTCTRPPYMRLATSVALQSTQSTWLTSQATTVDITVIILHISPLITHTHTSISLTGRQARDLRCIASAEGWHCSDSSSHRSQQKNIVAKIQNDLGISCKTWQKRSFTIREEWVRRGIEKRDLFYLGIRWDQERKAHTTDGSKRWLTNLLPH